MARKLKITAKIQKHGSSEIETSEILAAIENDESIDYIINMAFGSFYKILEYSFETADIYISDQYCKEVVIGLLKY